MADFYNNIAVVYYDQKKYTEALDFYKKSLAIRKQHLPSNHPAIAASHNNIGLVYSNLNKYDIAMSYENIALIHEGKRE